MTNPLAGWDITINAENVEPEYIIEWADEHFKRWAFQLEKGEKTGYLHYQFRGSLHTKKRESGVVKLFNAAGFSGHVRPTCEKTFATEDAKYVMKPETRVEGPWHSGAKESDFIPVDMKDTPVWRPMQQKIIDYIATPPNRRNIYCIVDRDGNKGKSFLAMWLYCHGECNYIPFFTEAKDLMRMVHGLPTRKAYFIDLPRALSHKAEYEIYGGIEMLKTGIIYEDRYHFRMKAINPVHVIVFTNKIPDMKLCSADRWIINDISDVPNI